MPRIGMWRFSRSRPVAALHPLATVRFSSGRPRLSPWLPGVCQRLPMAILAMAVVLVCTGCRGDSTAATQPSRAGQDASPAKQVRVTPVAEKPMERSTVALGSLAAFDQATVSVKVPGRLRSISVDLGSVVQQGQLIAQIDPQDYQLRVQQAEAALTQARARLGVPLTGNTDRIEPEQTSTVRQARALLEEAKTNRDRQAHAVRSGNCGAFPVGQRRVGL